MPTSPELLTSNNWDWVETLKNSFTLVKLGHLHKNEILSLSVIRMTLHSKIWVTTHSKQRWVTTYSRKKYLQGEYITNDQVRRMDID
jgi:hypothetical protein